MKIFSLAQQAKIVELLAPAADAAGRTSDAISMKNCAKAFVVFHITQGNAATILLTPRMATDVAIGTNKVFTNLLPIWADLDTAASDALVRATDAINYTTDAGVKNKVVVFEVDPSSMDVNGGYDVLYFTTGASNAANITQAMAYLMGLRYEQSLPPSAIVD